MTERPRPLDAGGVFVDAIEDAGTAQVTIGGGEAAIDLIGAEGREPAEKRPPVRAHAAVAVHHLVKNARQRPIAGNELFEACAFAIDNGVEVGCHIRYFRSYGVC